jgi:hypothetical protein
MRVHDESYAAGHPMWCLKKDSLIPVGFSLILVKLYKLITTKLDELAILVIDCYFWGKTPN